MSFRSVLRLGLAIAGSIVVGMIYLYFQQGGISSGGMDTPSVVARQVGLLNRAIDDRKDASLSLVAPPTNLDEAKATKKALDTYLASDGPGAIDWEKFRAWAAAQGNPETVAAFDHLWGERSAALAAYRRLVEDLASAPPDAGTAGPWADARRTEQYVSLYNAFVQKEEMLYDWTIRLTPADFKN